jgi:hypothetical protein
MQEIPLCDGVICVRTATDGLPRQSDADTVCVTGFRFPREDALRWFLRACDAVVPHPDSYALAAGGFRCNLAALRTAAAANTAEVDADVEVAGFAAAAAAAAVNPMPDVLDVYLPDGAEVPDAAVFGATAAFRGRNRMRTSAAETALVRWTSRAIVGAPPPTAAADFPFALAAALRHHPHLRHTSGSVELELAAAEAAAAAEPVDARARRARRRAILRRHPLTTSVRPRIKTDRTVAPS